MSGSGYGANRDTAGMNAGTSGSQAFGDRPGTAEVHSGLHSGRTDDTYSGIAFAGAEQDQGLRGRATGAVHDAAGTVRETVGNLGERAGDVASQARDRAGEFASQARDRVSGLMDRANTTLENRGVTNRLRENPLPALGVAFAVGFILAGTTESTGSGVRGGGAMGAMGSAGGRGARAQNELRNALVAGLSAGVAQGARQFLNQAGREGGFLNSVLQNVLGQAEQVSSRMGGATTSPSGMGGGATAGGRTGMGGTTTGATPGARAGTVHREPSHREFR